MANSILRVLWGKAGETDTAVTKRLCMNNDIRLMMSNRYEMERKSPIFVFGSENLVELEDMGLNCVLVDKRPAVWTGCAVWRHKMEAMRLASEMFDCQIMMDIDCLQTAPMPVDFWDVASRKMPVQASLVRTRRRRCGWRKGDRNRHAMGCYMYTRGREQPLGIIRTWEGMGSMDDDEMAVSKYLDDLVGGWKGDDFYLANFEPDHFTTSKHPAFGHVTKPGRCFDHFQSTACVEGILREIESGKKPDWCV